MPVAETWAISMLVAAFAGGAFGAAIGALPSFALTGLLVIVGELYRIVYRSLPGAAAGGPEPIDLTGTLAFGAVFGPHVAFGGGAAAVAYAAKRGYLEPSDFQFHPAKRITHGLGSRPDVLAVGGLFGVAGYAIAGLATTVSAPTDPVALGVVGSALLHRVLFGYSIVGAPVGQLLGMAPYRRAVGSPADDETDVADRRDSEQEATDLRSDGTLPVEPWLPYQYRFSHVFGIGVVGGLVGAYVAYLTASPFLAFGVSAFSLALMTAGVDKIPVTHHVTLPASTAVLALVEAPASALTPAVVASGVPLETALLVGLLFGVFGSLVGEFAQRLFYAHAETHLDPPAASIVVSSLVIAGLAMLGLLPGSVWIPTP